MFARRAVGGYPSTASAAADETWSVMASLNTYPAWSYFPRHARPAEWVDGLVQVFEEAQSNIDSTSHKKMESDTVTQFIREPLETLGWEVERGKKKEQKIARPVLFGDNGVPVVQYEIDGWHPEHRAVLEIESGRAVMGNAIYRDLIRTSLIQGADYLVLGVRTSYSYGTVKDQNDYEKTRDQLEAIYASGRLHLPFKGMLLIGW